jgi:cytoskeletal protein RodZ
LKHSQRDTVHRVRAVRSWLEKAEASFDKEADIKGELNLMLAEAEMKNLRKHHPVSKGWLRTGALVTAFCLAMGGWYVFQLPRQAERPPAGPLVVQEAAAGNEAVPLPADETASEAGTAPAAERMTPVRETPAPPALTAESATPAAPVRDELTVQPAATAVTAPEPPAPVRTEPKAVLSDRQVQATVQEARHTLRGTSTTK